MDEMISLPGTSDKIPRLGLGVYQLKGEECVKACLAALESGYRQLDSAQLYGNEGDVGRALLDYLRQSGNPREHVFVTTKIGRHGVSEEATYQSALRSVKRIAGEDGHVDLFLLHRPTERRRDAWRALERLLGEGKAKNIGVSNFRIEHLEEMREYARAWPPVVNQIEVSPPRGGRHVVGGSLCSPRSRVGGVLMRAGSPVVSAAGARGILPEPRHRRAGVQPVGSGQEDVGSGAGAGRGAGAAAGLVRPRGVRRRESGGRRRGNDNWRRDGQPDPGAGVGEMVSTERIRAAAQERRPGQDKGQRQRLPVRA